MTFQNAALLASEAGESEGFYWMAVYIGGGFFLFLMALLAGIIAFGGGREHS